MIRYIVGPKAFGEKKSSQADEDAISTEIWDIIFVKLEQNLNEKGRDFFCSDETRFHKYSACFITIPYQSALVFETHKNRWWYINFQMNTLGKLGHVKE